MKNIMTATNKYGEITKTKNNPAMVAASQKEPIRTNPIKEMSLSGITAPTLLLTN